MKPSSNMKILFTIGIVAGFVLVGASVVFYLYWSPWSGMLPMVSYPFRQYALPTAVVGAIVLILVPLLYFALVRRE